MPKPKSAKPAKIEAVLFDWDGTLLDSYHADSSAYLAMFREMGIEWGLAELAQHYSPNWHNVYRAAGLPRRCWNDADDAWHRQYTNHKPKMIPGARQVLERLRKNYRLALVTSGDRKRITRQLREFRLTRYFPVRVCGGDTLRRKPHPAPLRLALQQLGLKPSSCIYVGDAPEDVQMAQRVEMCVAAVLGPFPTEKRLRKMKPEILLNSVREVPALLKEFLENERDSDG